MPVLDIFQDSLIQMHIDALLCMMYVLRWVIQVFELIYGRYLGELSDLFIVIEEIYPKLMLNKFVLINTVYYLKGWVQALSFVLTNTI
jgi:hypothetical protein